MLRISSVPVWPVAMQLALTLLVVACVPEGYKPPPIVELAPIGNQEVQLGTTLALKVRAKTNSENPLTYLVTPLPLPKNATLDATSGEFRFAPAEDQVGSFELTFSASEGTASDSETIVVKVLEPPADGITRLSGRLLDTNDFVNDTTTPVVGATVSILGTGISATSDANGGFILSGIPAGSQIFDIDTSTANPAPNGDRYAGFREEMTIIEKVDNAVERPFFLPRIDPNGVATVDPGQTTFVENQPLGVSIEIPPSTARNADGSLFAGELSVSEVPGGLAPAALPDALQPGLLITIQPVGVRFDPPVPITFSGLSNVEPGTDMDIWSLDPEAGEFVVVGQGVVSADGTQVTTVSGGIRAADWHFFGPPRVGPEPAPEADGDNQDPDDPCAAQGGSRVVLYNGCLETDIVTPAYVSLDEERSLRFVYKANRAYAHPVIPFDVTIPVRLAVPKRVSYAVDVGGVSLGREVFVDTSGLNEDLDETVRAAVGFDASSLPTGVYPYAITATNTYCVGAPCPLDTAALDGESWFERADGPFELLGTRLASLWEQLSRPWAGREVQAQPIGIVNPISRFSSTLSGDQIVVNEKESPFGAGWGLEGLQRLYPQDDGSILLTDGNGLAKLFRLANFPPASAAALEATALSFDGVNDHVETASTNALNSLPLTLEAWVKPVVRTDGTTDFPNNVISNDNPGLAGHGFGVTVLPSAQSLNVQYSVGFHEIPYPFRSDRWYHVAVVYTPGNFKAYVDGELVEDFPFNQQPINGVGFVRIGKHNDDAFRYGTRRFFKGDIDEVRVWNVDRTADELRLNMRRQPDGTEPGLAHYWRLDEGSGATTSDQTPNAATGMLGAGNPDESPQWVMFPAGGFVAPLGDFSSFAQNPDGTFTRRLRNGTEFHFDPDGLLRSVVDQHGNTNEFLYDPNNRLTKMIDSLGLETTFRYAGAHLQTIIDPAARTTTLHHDSSGNLTDATLPNGSTRSFAYDPRHLMINETDSRGFTIAREYDKTGRLTQITLPDRTERRTTNAQLVGWIDPSSSSGTSELRPGPARRPEQALSTVTDPEGRSQTVRTGELGDPILIVDPAGMITRIERDSDSNPNRTILPSGHTFSRTYDEVTGDLLTSTDNTLGGTSTFTHTSSTNQSSITITDPRNHTTTISTNLDSSTLTMPSNRVAVVTRNDRGLPETFTDPLRTAVHFSYNTHGNLAQISAGDGPARRTTRFAHTEEGYVERITDPVGRDFLYAYDLLGRPTSETRPDGRTIVYEYAAADWNPTSVTPPGRPPHSYDYNSSGQLTRYTPPGLVVDSVSTFYTYDAANRLVRALRPDGIEVHFVYDEAGRPLRLTSLAVSVEYSYDENGRLVRIASLPDNVTTSYDYDGGLVVAEDWDGPVEGEVRRLYDTDYLLRSMNLDGGNVATYDYDADHLLIRAGEMSLIRDPRAGLLRGSTLGNISDVWTYNYFGEPVVYTVTYNGRVIYHVAYTRDKLGRIVEKAETTEQGTNTYSYSYDSGGRLVDTETQRYADRIV